MNQNIHLEMQALHLKWLLATSLKFGACGLLSQEYQVLTTELGNSIVKMAVAA